MKRWDLWKLSLLNIFASPMRSLLTVLGMAIGVGAILAVITLGEAGRTQVRSEMGRLGIDKVWITAEQEQTLRQGDAHLLSQTLHVSAAEAVYLNTAAACGRSEETVTVVGCEQDYLNMSGIRILEGRRLYPLEWEADGRSLLLGCAAATALGVELGDMVSLLGTPFRVRGIVEGASSFSRVDAAAAVFVPIRAMGNAFGDTVHEIMLDVPDSLAPQTVAAMAQQVLDAQRNTAVETLTLQVQMEAADSVVGIFVEVLKWVALVCVLVGGIGVMNILLVSVRERRREIGIMKSLGTTHRQICTLFLLEALSYSLIGGALGMGVGHVLIAIAGQSIGLNARANAADCICVFLAALMIGLFFGVAPASKAAALKCAEALQSE